MKVDNTVLLFRFLAGFLLGGLAFLLLSWVWAVPLLITAPIPFITGLCSAIWGDRFILALGKMFGKVL